MVRPWCDYRDAYLSGKVRSGRKERVGNSLPGSMPDVPRKILGRQAPQENPELILASKEIVFWTADFMPAQGWQELHIIPDLRRL